MFSMDDPWQPPTGQVPPVIPHATQLAREGGISFEACSHETDSSLYSDFEYIENRSYLTDSVQRTSPGYRSRVMLNGCVDAELVGAQVDRKKRKPSANDVCASAKKVKVNATGHRSQSSRGWQLPAEIWQHVFTFLPPKMLGRLLFVSKCFNFLLDPLSGYYSDASFPVVTTSLSIKKPEAIWQLSRRRFWPTMPNPLRDHTELQMWQLACQRGCQFHSKTDQPISSAISESPNGEYKHSTPQPIWSFALRSCMPCLETRITKDVDLLLSSSTPSCLIPALPFIFIGDDMSVISSAMLQSKHATARLSMAKNFLASHVAAIQAEFISVKAMGEATAEEWLKGLKERGRERRADSLRWEKFEMSGGLARIRRLLSSTCTEVNSKLDEATKVPKPSAIDHVEKQSEPLKVKGDFVSPETALATLTPSLVCSWDPPHAQPSLQSRIRSQINIPRNKTREEAEEMKATRRAEIEKRAMELKPPIPAHILSLIPSFQAAIQITSPLDNAAWNLLKSRLVAQRQDVDREQEQETSSQSQCTLQQSSKNLTLETKQQVDRTWDDVQAPLRARISVLADQIIRDGWEGGRKVNKESTPQFAAEVLLHVRTQFYTEIQEDDSAARAAGQQPISEPVNGPYTRRLTLENMKWLFDVKIKPFTETYRKELFYCYSCEVNAKLYGFEGVVQHYAAKHTSHLSLGSIVVHWRAEWPEVPPFHPEPDKLKRRQARPPKYKSNGGPGAITRTTQEQYLHREGAIPNYGHPISHNQYDTVSFPSQYGQSPPYMAPSHEHSHGFQVPQRSSNIYLYGNPYQGPPGTFHDISPDLSIYGPIQTTTVDAHQNYACIPHQNHPIHGSRLPHPYNSKLEEIARNSRELWFSIASIKGLPGPVRIFVVIHHMSSRFRTRFLEEPPLNLFIDGLSDSKEMRPIRNVNGLRCKACCLGLGINTVAAQDKDSYSLPQLAKHFYQRHIEQSYAVGAPELNWCIDMVYLPDFNVLSNLGNMTNIDNRKLALISTALSQTASQLNPGQFPPPRLLNHKIPSHRNRFSTVYPSHQQAPLPHTRFQHLEILQDTGQDDPEPHNLDKGTLETTQSKPSSKSLLSKADDRYTNGVCADITATSDEKPSLNTELAKRQLSTNDLARCPDQDTPGAVENDEDDSFDLLAGLESQLDRQALSNCLDTP